MEPLTNEFLGKGLYNLSEASRFTRINSQKISRILFGYKRVSNLGEERCEASMWESEFKSAEHKVVSFRDLMELRFMEKFQIAGLTLQKLRKIRKVLVERTNTPYPFSSMLLRTDGVKMFFEEEIHDEVRTVEVFSGQENFREIVEQSFMDVDYGDLGPERWWIGGRSGGIILDPQRSFGQPIIADFGVPTSAIADYVVANNNNLEQAAKDFCIPESIVARACSFEEQAPNELIH